MVKGGSEALPHAQSREGKESQFVGQLLNSPRYVTRGGAVLILDIDTPLGAAYKTSCRTKQRGVM